MDSSNRTALTWKVLFLLVFIAIFSTLWKVSVLAPVNKFDFYPKYKNCSYVKYRNCSCEKCLTDNHKWFMQHFKKSVSPFLTSNYTLPYEDFDWWKRIQPEGRDMAYFKRTTEKLFKVVPNYPVVAKPGPNVCRTCAVVGNSGNLRKSHYGKLINHHKYVFRINFGKIKGYEEDVGNRTTHRVMYPESSSNLDQSTHLVLFPFKIKDLEWLLDRFTPPTPKIAANRSLVMVGNPAFIKYVHGSWLQRVGSYPSTGFITVILALHLCDEVSVFGFGADSDGNWSHYWEVLSNKRLRTGPHPGSAEYNMIVELANQGKITFYRGPKYQA